MAFNKCYLPVREDLGDMSSLRCIETCVVLVTPTGSQRRPCLKRDSSLQLPEAFHK